MPGNVDTFEMEISPNVDAILTNWNQSPQPQMVAYQYSSTGIGTRYTDPTTTPIARKPIWTLTGNKIVYATTDSVTMFTQYRDWNSSTGFGTQVSGPTFAAGFLQRIVMHPSNNSVAFAATGAPTDGTAAQVFAWSELTNYGTAYPSPSTPFEGNGANGVSFHPNGSTILLTANGGPHYIGAYQWSNTTGYGTRYANPASALPSNGTAVTFSPKGDSLVAGSTNTPYIHGYSWTDSSGFGTKYANPVSLPAGQPVDVRFTPGGTETVIGTSTTPAVLVYKWGPGFGSTYASPTPLGISPRRRGVAVSNYYR
jgi:hypothetical protein